MRLGTTLSLGTVVLVILAIVPASANATEAAASANVWDDVGTWGTCQPGTPGWAYGQTGAAAYGHLKGTTAYATAAGYEYCSSSSFGSFEGRGVLVRAGTFTWGDLPVPGTNTQVHWYTDDQTPCATEVDHQSDALGPRHVDLGCPIGPPPGGFWGTLVP